MKLYITRFSLNPCNFLTLTPK